MTQPAVRDPYGHALSAIRRLTQEGRFGWGQPLVVKDLAEEFGLSPTPVREALARLAGEGLIERQKRKGYFFPALTGPDIVDLYGLEWGLVHSALALHPLPKHIKQKIGAQARVLKFDSLFRMVVAQSGNELLLSAFDHVMERLIPVRAAQDRLGHSLPTSSRDIAFAIAEGPVDAVAHLLEAHQNERCAAASEVARFLQRSSGHKV